MNGRQASRTWLGFLFMFVVGCTLPSEGMGSSPGTAQQQRVSNPSSPSDRLQIAFDVRSRNHRRTTRYLLEVVDANGTKTVHDLKRPRPRRGTITVPLPDLAPGKYTFVIIAETDAGPLRSAEISYEIKNPARK